MAYVRLLARAACGAGVCKWGLYPCVRLSIILPRLFSLPNSQLLLTAATRVTSCVLIGDNKGILPRARGSQRFSEADCYGNEEWAIGWWCEYIETGGLSVQDL